MKGHPGPVKRVLRMAVFAGLLLCGTACAPVSGVGESTPTVEVSPTVNAAPTPLALSPEAPPDDPVTRLVVWWPDRLAPVGDEALYELINAQIEGFVESEDNVEIDFRRRRSQEVGGIMSTLRSASSVAPGALPDVTLIRREDLLAAVQEGLIQPLDALISPVVAADLYPPALRLGTINDQVYGLAYILEIQLLVYDTAMVDEVDDSWSFETVLSEEIGYAFPAARVTGLSDTFYLQYISAGGNVPEAGTFNLDRDALTETLRFYEEAHATGLVDEAVLGYSTTLDYRPMLLDGTLSAGVVNSSALISLLNERDSLSPASIPTADGVPTTLLNGWLWVVVTNNAERRGLSSRFINWMMDPNRHSAYAEQIAMLPSLRESMRQRPYPAIEGQLLEAMLNNALLPLSDSVSGVVLRAMQNALVAVISGGSSAEDAALSVLDQIPSS